MDCVDPRMTPFFTECTLTCTIPMTRDTEGPISGTSAATPTFAGIVSLINAKRLAAGKKGLGFLNYALYGGKAGAGVGYDVQQGATKSDGFCKEGWPATAGWDACTGLAAPRYETLLDTLMAV